MESNIGGKTGNIIPATGVYKQVCDKPNCTSDDGKINQHNSGGLFPGCKVGVCNGSVWYIPLQGEAYTDEATKYPKLQHQP